MLRHMAARTSGLGSLAARTLAISQSATTVSRQYATASGLKSYDDIPGPRQYPFLGSASDMVWAKLTGKSTYDLWMKKYQKYGRIYRYKLPTLDEAVVIHEPADVEAMCRAEGRYPRRIPLTAIVQARRDIGLMLGLFML